MSDILKDLSKYQVEFTNIRHQFHENPEIGFEEVETSNFIAEKLKSWGYSVTRCIAETGLVASLKLGNSKKTIGIRAEMDALPMCENKNEKKWYSHSQGRFHGCGHDGHCATLLCAARYMAEKRDFNGTVNLIFQPAEETLLGAQRMLKDGLFEAFKCDKIFSFHNMPGYPIGTVILKNGAAMASNDIIHIEVTGKSAHGAYPEQGVDAIIVASHIIIALQSIISRNISPLQSAVITVGSIESGSVPNIMNEKAYMKLSVRSLDRDVRNLVIQRIKEISNFQAQSFGATSEVKIINGAPGLYNDENSGLLIKQISEKILGTRNVFFIDTPAMGSEDFAFMLESNPNGYYFYLGNGNSANLHHPDYDFNDQLISIGAAIWVELVGTYLK